MLRLAFILHFVIASTLMGVGVVVVLVMGMTGARPIWLAALAGFVLAFPVTWFVTKSITAMKGSG